MNTNELPRSAHRGVTLVELIIAIAVIVVLVAILLPALASVRKQALMASSQSNLRQIAHWIALYASDNRDTVLPSQFDYSQNSNKGHVRSIVTIGDPHQGTWADILWTIHRLGTYELDPDTELVVNHYRYDAPDFFVYHAAGGAVRNPLRSAAMNTADFCPDWNDSNCLPKPYGQGAQEHGLPGFFAANDFFNARPDAPPDANGNNPPPAGRWYSMGQIRVPDRSMYMVDSLAGEVIDPEDDGAWDAIAETIEVDFRYSDVALMLFLDGHIDPQPRWYTRHDLEGCQGVAEVSPGRGLRLRGLTSRTAVLQPCPP